MHIELDPLLLEDVVFLAIRRREQLGDRVMVRDYRNRVDSLYELAGDDPRREIAFRDVHAEFFQKLGFERMLRECLDEFPLLARRLDRVSFLKAVSRKQEGAELFVRENDEGDGGYCRTAVVRLRAEILLDPDDLLALLRRELYHVSDMVDPAFDYHPDLGDEGESIAQDNLVRDRYRALWSTFVEARLLRSGRTTAATLERQRSLLGKAFEGLDDRRVETIFDTAANASSLTHADLVALARNGSAELVTELSG